MLIKTAYEKYCHKCNKLTWTYWNDKTNKVDINQSLWFCDVLNLQVQDSQFIAHGMAEPPLAQIKMEQLTPIEGIFQIPHLCPYNLEMLMAADQS